MVWVVTALAIALAAVAYLAMCVANDLLRYRDLKRRLSEELRSRAEALMGLFEDPPQIDLQIEEHL